MNLSKDRDFQYFSAKTPERAYDILNEHDMDIIITGLEFENASGVTFIKNLIEKKHRSTPVIVLSATEDIELKLRLFEMGVTEYLTKDKFLDYLNSYINKLKTVDSVVSQLKGLRIAVLDDNESHLATMQNFLSNNGIHQVDYFIHPRALITSKKQFHIYIVDLIMPDITGEEVITQIRGRDEYAVIIAVSSLDSISVMTDILASGADDYVTKPLSEKLFMARIKANVRTYSLMEELKDKNMRLEHLVKEDGLTGLYNHKSIIESLDKEIERAQRYNTPLSIIMFDIDKFKTVNDTYGHHIGDEVLEKLGSYLKNMSRDFDIAGRYGGEEFIIILPETDMRGSVLYGNRFRTEIEAMTFSEPNLRITISGGIAIFSPKDTSVEMIKRADSFLYEAKNNGRNRIEFE